jgi:hypothetical protein
MRALGPAQRLILAVTVEDPGTQGLQDRTLGPALALRHVSVAAATSGR